MVKSETLYHRIYDLVRQIPEGRFATYGQIAQIIGSCSPRNVGYAMASVNPDDDVPWHRVINAQGRISIRSDGEPSHEQRRLLKKEGIQFKRNDRIDLTVYGWEGLLDNLEGL